MRGLACTYSAPGWSEDGGTIAECYQRSVHRRGYVLTERPRSSGARSLPRHPSCSLSRPLTPRSPGLQCGDPLPPRQLAATCSAPGARCARSPLQAPRFSASSIPSWSAQECWPSGRPAPHVALPVRVPASPAHRPRRTYDEHTPLIALPLAFQKASSPGRLCFSGHRLTSGGRSPAVILQGGLRREITPARSSWYARAVAWGC
jgi:hypothetical protein